MAFYLRFRTAQRSRQHNSEQFAGLAVQSGAGVKIAETEFCQKTGRCLSEITGKPGIAVGNLCPVDRSLDIQTFPVTFVLAFSGQCLLERQQRGCEKVPAFSVRSVLFCPF